MKKIICQTISNEIIEYPDKHILFHSKRKEKKNICLGVSSMRSPCSQWSKMIYGGFFVVGNNC
jgi:hypothetical protein